MYSNNNYKDTLASCPPERFHNPNYDNTEDSGGEI